MHLLPVASLGAQRRQPDGILRKRATAQPGQCRLRTDFDEEPAAHVVQRREALREPHGLAQMPLPVLGDADLLSNPSPVRLETSGMRGAPTGLPRRRVSNSVEDRIHQRASGTRARPPAAPRHALLAASCAGWPRRRPPRRRSTTSSGPLTAAIERCRSARTGRSRTRASPAKIAAIVTARRQRLHQPAARGDQPQPVFQAEHAGDARGGVLADAVAEHGARGRCPRTPELGAARIRGRTAPAACRPSG